MIKCEFCDSVIPYNVSQCPSCGAPCKFIPAPEDEEKTPFNDSDSNSSPKQHVVSMEDVDIPIQSSQNESFLDDLESELDEVEQTAQEDQRNKVVGCTVLSIILIVVAFILWKCFS